MYSFVSPTSQIKKKWGGEGRERGCLRLVPRGGIEDKEKTPKA